MINYIFTKERTSEVMKRKKRNIRNYVSYQLAKTSQMFRYFDLPETIPKKELENILQINGHCGIMEVNGELYAFKGSFTGEPDVYDNPTEYTISNLALNIFGSYKIGEEIEIIYNDSHGLGLIPILEKYGILITDTELSIYMAITLKRAMMLLSSGDDKTKYEAELFLKKLEQGDLSVIGENQFLEGIKVHSTYANDMTLNQLTEQLQYFKSSLLNELGLQSQWNQKRATLSVPEIMSNIDTLLPFIHNMFEERVEGLERINKKFNLNCVVDYNSAWKTTQEYYQKETSEAEVLTDMDLSLVRSEVSSGIDMEEPLQESLSEPKMNKVEATVEPTPEPNDEPTPEPNDEPTPELKKSLEEVIIEVLEDERS